jgi:transposase
MKSLRSSASVARLDQPVEPAAKSQALALRLMTHPGVGPVTSLAFVLILGPVNRFAGSKQVSEGQIHYAGGQP